MHPLYPKISPNNTQFLSCGSHQIYVEESGNPDGIPVLYLHGGPGGGSCPDHRRYFDPEKYRIIIFDQRGCGKSTPHASLENNTTADLIDDIEKIRSALAITKWVVAGGSWGTTLALAYGIAYPQTVSGFILRGIFLGTQEEINWLYGKNGAANFFPCQYQEFLQPLSQGTSDNIIEDYFHELHSDNELARIAAAKAWTLWETKISALFVDKHEIIDSEETHGAIAMAHIENHYFKHHCFFDEGHLLNSIDKISHIPAFIIHGRYDMVCQIKHAWLLNEAWENAQLQIIPKAGHSGFEPGIADAICRAADQMVDFIIDNDNKN